MNRFKNILYVLSNQISETSPSLIRAISLAKNNQADLTLLQILPAISSFFISNKVGISEQDLRHKVLARENAALQQLVSSLDSELSVKTTQVTGKHYIEIIRQVQSKGFDLVVKQADDIDWLDRLLGSDDMHLLRKCPCPVWLMKKGEKPVYQHIMAAVDFDEEDETCNAGLNSMILEFASSLSLPESATLHVVNAYDVPQAGFISLYVDHPDKVEKQLFEAEYLKRQYKMSDIMDDLKQKIGVKSFNYLSPRTHIVQGPPGRELPKAVDDFKADLVVMGTVARTGIAGVIIGNTAETILSELQCSVLAIKPKGFVCPIS